MKKFIYLFAAAAMLLSGCGKDEDICLTITSGNELTFSGEGGSQQVTIESNANWEVAGSNEWVTVTPTKGSGDGAFTVTVAENYDTNREQTLTVTYGMQNATVKVSQTAATSIEYAGETYGIAKMKDGRIWMTENLRYVPSGKTPSSNPADGNGIWYPTGSDGKAATDAASVKAKGYLYDYATILGKEVNADNFKNNEGAQGICPDGWYIPTRADFVALCGNSTKAEGETEALVDETAAYYDKGYNGAKITALDADNFNWQFAGMINRTDATKTGSYLTVVTKESTCSVADYMGNPAMTYLMGSTGYAVNAKNKNIQFFGMMSTFTKTYLEGRLTCGYSNYLAGQSLRCIKK